MHFFSLWKNIVLEVSSKIRLTQTFAEWNVFYSNFDYNIPSCLVLKSYMHLLLERIDPFSSTWKCEIKYLTTNLFQMHGDKYTYITQKG